MSEMTYSEAVNFGLRQAMAKDERMVCYGLGVNDPKRIFGTTDGLVEEFGPERVFDTPTSENALTGIAIGLSLTGIRSVVTHQRLDFFLLAMDQLINSAAKWHYMFGGQNSVPITIRLIVGKGWGQGPTHSQSLHSWFAHIPGLKVVVPSTPSDAKGLLLSAIEDPNPVIIIEHRWLHNTLGEVPNSYELIPIGKARVMNTGNDVTIISSSFLTIKILSLKPILEQLGISFDLIDLRSFSPIDWECIYSSVRKTKKVIVFDFATTTGSIASEIIAKLSIELFQHLEKAPVRVASPDTPEPTSFGLTRGYYLTEEKILATVAEMVEVNIENQSNLLKWISGPHDIPGPDFKGPF